MVTLYLVLILEKMRTSITVLKLQFLFMIGFPNHISILVRKDEHGRVLFMCELPECIHSRPGIYHGQHLVERSDGRTMPR